MWEHPSLRYNVSYDYIEVEGSSSFICQLYLDSAERDWMHEPPGLVLMYQYFLKIDLCWFLNIKEYSFFFFFWVAQRSDLNSARFFNLWKAKLEPSRKINKTTAVKDNIILYQPIYFQRASVRKGAFEAGGGGGGGGEEPFIECIHPVSLRTAQYMSYLCRFQSLALNRQ